MILRHQDCSRTRALARQHTPLSAAVKHLPSQPLILAQIMQSQIDYLGAGAKVQCAVSCSVREAHAIAKAPELGLVLRVNRARCTDQREPLRCGNAQGAKCRLRGKTVGKLPPR